MPVALRTTMFPASLEQLHGLRAFLEAFCAQAGIGREACLRLNLLLEELFTNTVRHGHRGDCDAPVWISLVAGEDRRVTITYEDTAPPFNPYARISPDTTQEIGNLRGRVRLRPQPDPPRAGSAIAPTSADPYPRLRTSRKARLAQADLGAPGDRSDSRCNCRPGLCRRMDARLLGSVRREQGYHLQQPVDP
jgi:serine/threonine-protein kinase RsbW